MKNYTKIRMIATLSFVALISAMLGNACSGFKSGSGSGLSSGGGDFVFRNDGELACKSQADFIAVEGSKTPAIVTKANILENMKSCTQFTNISQATVDSYNQRNASFSKEGYIGDINSALMMGVAAVAVEFCNDLANSEAAMSVANRKFFSTVDFAGTSLTNTTLDSVIGEFAAACWEPEEISAGSFLIATPEELQIVRDEIAAMGAVNAKLKAVAICTAALSSLKGISL